MKSFISTILIVFTFYVGLAQTNERLTFIQNTLDSLSASNKGLSEKLDASISLNEVTLSNFLLAISNVHKVNINIAPELDTIKISNNLSDVTVSNVLMFLCEEYDLNITFTGNILSIKPYIYNTKNDTYPIKIDFDYEQKTYLNMTDTNYLVALIF